MKAGLAGVSRGSIPLGFLERLRRHLQPSAAWFLRMETTIEFECPRQSFLPSQGPQVLRPRALRAPIGRADWVSDIDRSYSRREAGVQGELAW
jgi:hypothetical protein